MATIEQQLVPLVDESPDTEFGRIPTRSSIVAAQAKGRDAERHRRTARLIRQYDALQKRVGG